MKKKTKQNNFLNTLKSEGVFTPSLTIVFLLTFSRNPSSTPSQKITRVNTPPSTIGGFPVIRQPLLLFSPEIQEKKK